MSDNDDRLANRIVGDVHGSSVANVVHGSVYINATNPVDHAPEIDSLLRAQVQAAQDLPQRLPGASRPALADVYVRQDLGTGVDTSRSEPPQPTPILDGHGQLVEVPGPPPTRIAIRPPVRTVRQALDDADHLVVTGGAGQGKSTLSLRLAADAAAHWLGTGEAALTEPLVPLRLTARALAARLHLPFADALADSVRADYGSFLRKPVSAAALSERVRNCRWLLLVDGLDEVADGDDRDRLAKVLASCAAESTYRVVLTTRPIEGTVLAPLQRIGAVRYELQPFDEEALRRFAENWFATDGSELAERFLRQIRAAHLDDLVRVPLLATIAAIVFQTHVDLPLPDNEYELYEAYTSYLRSIRPADQTFEPFRVPLLEHLGVVRVESDTSLVTAAREWIRAKVSTALPLGWPERLTEFLVAAGPLVRRGEDMTFLHHSFAEHLAATAKARSLPTTFTADHDDFVRLLYAASPKESGRYARSVALHYTRLHPDQADPLLQSLHARGADQHLLAARLLAKRMPATGPAIDAFLATVRGWAATTHYLADDILAHTCRATQHPALADWLAALMRDQTLPLSSRTSAAAALAVRVRGHHQPSALRFLRSLIDDPQVAIENRLTAAEALSDTGASERTTAERGLRSVLADNTGTGEDYRTAAVILAAFGPEARAFAVASLMRWLDDRNTAPSIVVEAATGLVEIGTEFHARAAEAYRLVLHDPMHNLSSRDDAALGLAALGPEFLLETAEALTMVIHDRHRAYTYRLTAAEVLARLGPQYRQIAGESVQAMLLEPVMHAIDTTNCAVKLAGFGPSFRECAVPRLQAQVVDPTVPTIQVISALDALRECGATREPELANQLWMLLNEVESDLDAYVMLLGRLSKLGGQHRASAVGRLRAHLSDGSAPATTRCRAASALIDVGPELHAEVTRRLAGIAETELGTEACLEAWRLLAKLGPQFRSHALAALLSIIQARSKPVPWFFQAQGFAASHADREMIADAMLIALRDDNRSFHERMCALNGLIGLGPRFHADAIRELCVMLHSVHTMVFDFRYVAMQLSIVGIGLREQVVRTLFTLAQAPEASIARIRAILDALELLGFSDTAETKTALRILIEHADTPVDRLAGQGMLATIDQTAVQDIAAEALSPAGGFASFLWPQLVGKLAALGVATGPALCALLSHPDVTANKRWESAMHLFTTFPTHQGEATAELECQLAADFRRPGHLAEVLTECVTVGAVDWDRAAEHLTDLVDDQSLAVYDRCLSASHYAAINRCVVTRLFAFVCRMADEPDRTADERAQAAYWARWPIRDTTTAPPYGLIASAALARGAGGQRRALIGHLRRDLRTRVERTLLADRALPIKERLPEPDVWDDLPLAAEVVAEIREVMTAPEFPKEERVEAAAALARLDMRANAEATALLEAPGSWRGKEALIRLGTLRGREVRREVERMAVDEGLALRVRRRAVEVLVAASPRTPPGLVVVLREIAEAGGERKRAEALLALGAYDGLAGLRAMRDDEGTGMSVRWYAATELRDYQVEDSVRAAELFEGIAGDSRERPALRWRAGKSLGERGRKGRKRAVELLWGMATDTRLPVGARARAASVLSEISPNRRGEVLELLNTMLDTEKPLLRRKVLLEIGECRQEEAALELLAMADEERHGAVVRMRCAEGAVALWRDCRDRAAVVVRAVANDDAVRWHVRRRAACHLARWSAVCREEARALIRELDGTAAVGR
ncbi:NACHT domain-containing protein [Kutzneria sp. NPDC052558]|uniref:NACHT domain-containing protein n=1 Tax=Kutzneria sp. NPDC052558 TaxID=3364121 RepID=UPI0037C70801